MSLSYAMGHACKTDASLCRYGMPGPEGHGSIVDAVLFAGLTSSNMEPSG